MCYLGIIVGGFVTAQSFVPSFTVVLFLCGSVLVLLSFLVLISRFDIICGLSGYGILVDRHHLRNSFLCHFS